MDTLLSLIKKSHEEVIATLIYQAPAGERRLRVVRGHKIKDYRMGLA
jgi:hypothetical protein